MKISKKCEYAIKVLLELCADPGSSSKNVRELSASTGVTPKFLELIMTDLRKAGWVQSTRGKDGGYGLTANPDDIRLSDIVNWVDGFDNPYDCRDRDGRESKYLGVYRQLSEIRRSLLSLLEEVTLRSLWDQSRELEEARAGYTMYYI